MTPILMAALATAAAHAMPADVDLPRGAVVQLGGSRLRYFHDNSELVAVSPDRTRVAAAAADGGLAEYDATTGKVGAVRFAAEKAIAYSPDGLTLAALGVPNPMFQGGRPVQFFHTATGREVGRIPPRDYGHHLSFGMFAGPDAFVCALGVPDEFRVWDVRKGVMVRAIPRIPPHNYYPKAAGVSPDGRYLAVIEAGRPAGRGLFTTIDPGDSDPPLVAYEVRTGREAWRVVVPGVGHRQLAFSPDGRSLVVDGLWSVYRYEAATGRPLGDWPVLRRLRRDHLAVGDDAVFLFKPDEATGLLSGHDLVARRAVEYPLTRPVGFPLQPGAAGLMVINGGCRLGVWDLTTGRAAHNRAGPWSPVTAAALLADGGAVAADFDALQVWGRAGRQERAWSFSERYSSARALSPDGRWFRYQGDAPAGGPASPLTEGDAMPPARQADPLHSDPAAVHIIDTATGRPTAPATVARRMGAGVFSPDGRVIAFRAGEQIRVQDAATGRELWSATIRSHGVEAVGFGAGGRRVYAADANGGVHELDAATGRTTRVLRGSRERADDVIEVKARAGSYTCTFAATPDGRRLITADLCGLRVWDLDTGEEAAPLERAYRAYPGHNSDDPLAVSPDGAVLAAAGPKGREDVIDLWDLGARRRFASLAGHKRPVTALGFSPDGRRLISGGADALAFIWAVPPRPDAAGPKAP